MRHLSLVAALLLVTSTANAEHRGFTAGIGASGGGTYLTSSSTANPNATEPGVGYTLTVGGFVRGDLAVGAHVSVLFAPFDDQLAKLGASVLGATVIQYFPNDHVSLMGGPGFVVMHYQKKDPADLNQYIGTEAGFTPLVGASVYPFADHGWRLSLEVAPVIASDGLEGVMSNVTLGWQYRRSAARTVTTSVASRR